jgi:hypothetical protein
VSLALLILAVLLFAAGFVYAFIHNQRATRLRHRSEFIAMMPPHTIQSSMAMSRPSLMTVHTHTLRVVRGVCCNHGTFS